MTEAGYDRLEGFGAGSGIERGECERLFQVLFAEKVLAERLVRAQQGAINAYLQVGPRANAVLAGKVRLQMGFVKAGAKQGASTKVEAAPKPVRRRSKVNETYDYQEYAGEHVDEYLDEEAQVYDGAQEDWCVL